MTLAPFVADSDFTLYVGDVRQVLAELPDGSVDCVITSPPYWGLRDYGTGQWDGGDPDCDHQPPPREKRKFTNGRGEGQGDEYAGSNLTSWTTRDATVKDGGCPKGCGARRVDQQLGLEPTPDQYVHNMVQVFREIRRVLAAHGTCWVNLGDSYASGEVGRHDGYNPTRAGGSTTHKPFGDRQQRRADTGLKPKDLVGIPWRVAFALQADGWYLRADVIWAKPNPMPESVTDRPTKAHEYVFLLTKRPRYWFDADAVREPHNDKTGRVPRGEGRGYFRPEAREARERPAFSGNVEGRVYNPAGRNVRSVWEIATQPYPEAHFATYPEELVRRCLLAGCPEWVCGTCGKPRERIVDVEYVKGYRSGHLGRGRSDAKNSDPADMSGYPALDKRVTTLGWSDCGCVIRCPVIDGCTGCRYCENLWERGKWRSGTVLDPFLGSGTTALVARRHGRHTIGIELNPGYAALAARRLQQLSLLAEGAAW